MIQGLQERSEIQVLHATGEANYEQYMAQLKKKGYIVITAGKYPLGFGKLAPDGSIKNLYPKAWRLI